MRTLYSLIWLSLAFKIKSEEILIKEQDEIISSTTLNSIITSTSISILTTSTSIPIISSSIIVNDDNLVDDNFIELGLNLKPIIIISNSTNQNLNLNETDSNELIINSTTSSSTIIDSISSTSITSSSTTTTTSIEIPTTENPSTPQQLNNSTIPITPETNSIPTPPIIESIPIPIPIPIIEIPSPPELLSFNEWREKYVPPSDPSSRRVRKLRSPPKSLIDQVTSESITTSQDSSSSSSVGDSGNGIGSSGEGIGNQNSTEGTLTGGGDNQDEKKREAKDFQNKIINSDQMDGSSTGEGSRDNKVSSPIQPLPNVGSGGPLDPLTALKDRSNYALFECSATVHRASKESKGSASILVEKKDRYMLTPCSADPQFVELELCDEIQIDTVALANFEFFSSMFKHFSIKVSVNYPGRVDEWHDLGTFRARNARGVQVFNTKALGSFYRYMRIDFLTHYGSEYFCPVSLLRVYGITQMDAFRRDERLRAIEAEALEKMLKEEEYEYVNEAEEVEEVRVEKIVVPEVVPVIPVKEEQVVQSSVVSVVEEPSIITSIEITPAPTATPTPVDEISKEEPITVARASILSTPADSILSITTASSLSSIVDTTSIESSISSSTPAITKVSSQSEISIESSSETPLPTPTASEPPPTASSTLSKSISSSLSNEVTTSTSTSSFTSITTSVSTTTSIDPKSSTVVSSDSASENSSTDTSADSNVSTTVVSPSASVESNDSSTTSASTVLTTAISKSSPPVEEIDSEPIVVASGASSSIEATTSTTSAVTSSSTVSIVSVSANITTSTIATISSVIAEKSPIPTPQPSPSVNRSEPVITRTQPTPPSPPPLTPPPNIQQQPGESIYGTIMKRLTGLEHNQTLSMHFIELQSGVLRDAFLRVEKRLGDIEGTRSELESLVRMGFREMEMLRKEMERERIELAGKVNILSQELLFERRLGVAQLIGLFALFVFVGLTRGSTTIPLNLVSREVRRRTSSKDESDSQDEDVRTRDASLHAFRNKIDRSDSTGSQESARKTVRTSSLPMPRSTGKRHSTVPRRNYSVAAPSKLSKTIRDWNPPRQSSAPPDIFSLPFSRAGTTNQEINFSSSSSPRRRTSLKQHRERESSTITITSSSSHTGISPTTPYKRLPLPLPQDDNNSSNNEHENESETTSTSGTETDSERETWNDTGDESTNSNNTRGGEFEELEEFISTSNSATPGPGIKHKQWVDGEDIEEMFNDTKGSPLPLKVLPDAPPEKKKQKEQEK